MWVGVVWCERGEGRDRDMGWGAGGVWLVGGWVSTGDLVGVWMGGVGWGFECVV